MLPNPPNWQHLGHLQHTYPVSTGQEIVFLIIFMYFFFAIMIYPDVIEPKKWTWKTPLKLLVRTCAVFAVLCWVLFFVDPHDAIKAAEYSLINTQRYSIPSAIAIIIGTACIALVLVRFPFAVMRTIQGFRESRALYKDLKSREHL